MDYVKSRNTLISSVIFFVIVVTVLKLSSGFFEMNVERVMTAILGGKAESIPLIDFSMIDFTKYNPLNWSPDNVRDIINEKMHEFIDTVLPAVIQLVNVAVIQVAVMLRVDMIASVGTTMGVKGTAGSINPLTSKYLGLLGFK